MKPIRSISFHRLLVWFAILAFAFAWGYSAAFADDDDDARLTALAISGPDSVNESSSASYTATATFSDGSKRTVTSSASWSDSSSYASISSGRLTTRAVTSNHSVTITARYSRNDVRRTAQKTVAILNGGSAPILTGLSVTGSTSVNESSTSAYSATASFSDGSTRNVSSDATWSENSSYATISTAGVLSASSVTGNQPVTITVVYASNGVSRSGTISATIIDASTPAPAPIVQNISILGPASVSENTTTAYSVSATMSNGTTKTVSTTMAEDSQFASFTGNNLVTTAVTGNQVVNISTSYSEGGITKTAARAISIVDNAQPPPVTGSHADRIPVYEGTKTCLQCHRTQAVAVHNSEHYQWAGKLGKINDFCIYPDINHIGKLTNVNGIEVDGGCSKCHVGKGAKPAPVSANPTDAQLENVDCLMCHSPKYKRTVDPVTKAQWIPDEAAMGMPILSAAVDIEKTSRDTCLNCHTKSGGGDNFKRGDIEEHHRAPATRAFDVHMSSTALGGGNLHCTSCHTVTNHKIAGKGADLRVQEGTGPSCTTCHTANPPHSNSNINSRHVKRVNCTVCHIPTFAKVAPTDTFRDWSAPGELNVATGLYDPARTMQKNLVPQYGWWDGKTSLYNFGTAAVPGASGNVYMAGPAAANASTAGAKIFAFKHHTALQPIDTVTKYLLPLKIGQFYMQGDLANAIPLGQDGVGWPRNPYDYEKTERWMGLFHEVSPKENALGYNNACTTCHGTTNPKVPLKSLGYTIKTGQTTATLCSSCHGSETYSFNAVHPRHTNEGYDCSRCHNFSKAP